MFLGFVLKTVNDEMIWGLISVRLLGIQHKFPGGNVDGRASHVIHVVFLKYSRRELMILDGNLTPVSVTTDFLKIQFETCL